MENERRETGADSRATRIPVSRRNTTAYRDTLQPSPGRYSPRKNVKRTSSFNERSSSVTPRPYTVTHNGTVDGQPPPEGDLYVINEINSTLAKPNITSKDRPETEVKRDISPSRISRLSIDSVSDRPLSELQSGYNTPFFSLGPTPEPTPRNTPGSTPAPPIGINFKPKFDIKGKWSSTTLSSAGGIEGEDVDEHINVVLRVRPLNNQEIMRKDAFVTSFPGAGRIECDANTSVRSFGFNVVFEPEATQQDLFEHSGMKKLVDMSLNGYACTALAFGQTGSGKTHTMTGPPQQFEGGKHPPEDMVGIMQRSFEYLVQMLQQNGGNKTLRASYLEIYNEQVVDLLNPVRRRNLQVRWSKNKGFYVENLFVVECETVDDMMAVLEEGMKYRQTGSHGLNETSSRSHSMMTLAIDSELQDPEDENLYITKRGKLTFVDLAGSEKVKDSHSTAETLIESNNINRSLLVLGNCISCLGDHRKRGGHVPYRDSKLTKLLADSLGGSGVTLMIACITPSSHHISETMNTLRYASRAKKIRTKPLIKMDPREKLIMSLKREIKILRNENQYLRQQLEFPEKTKAAMQNESDEKYKKFLKDQENNKSSDQPKKDPKSEEAGLYEMLQEYMIENEALRTENADLHATKDKIRREQQLLYKDNEKMMKRIEDLERLIGPTAWRRPPIDPYSQPSSNAPSQVQSPRQSPALQYRSPQPSGQPFPIGQQGRYPSQEQYAVAPSPNGTARGKGPPPPPPPNNSKPRRPPHRLAEPIMRPAQIPPDHQNGGPAYDHPPPSMPQQHMANGPIRQESPARMDSRATSQLSNTESVRSMNEKLKQELVELEGEIAHHQNMNQRTRSSMYGSQASIRSGPR
ncbi:kinesin-like protein KIF12 isoform X3 [Pecten maximus]|uniref:kinesin-like protein KIF12 isoform X3 n=1 Tax=Pecten maximus TaxID=6579 RepID=UPI0014585B2C|nr:kinesin-like protein KIF12 isoform X3 [Pecten maximus]